MLRFHDGKELLGNLLGTADAGRGTFWLRDPVAIPSSHGKAEAVEPGTDGAVFAAGALEFSRQDRGALVGIRLQTAFRDASGRACAPCCIFLLTMRNCWPVCVAVISIFATDGQWVGSREVRKAKPLSSPLTRKLPRVPQTLWTLKGMRRMVQPPNLFCRRSSVALKGFATGLGVVFFFMGVAERKNFNTRS